MQIVDRIGKELEKLPNEMKVDCITINCLPLKVAIDAQIQSVYDALVNALRRHITSNSQAVDRFLQQANEFMQGTHSTSLT